MPAANVSWTDAAMVQHKHADVGVAVSIPGGLITPIIRQADVKTLSVIANEMKDLASRAARRKLKPEEFQGGTTAVSNLGMFGVKDFAAVINPPHATILAVGAGEERAVVKKGEIKIATVMSVRSPPTTARSTARSAPNSSRPSSATSKSRSACWCDGSGDAQNLPLAGRVAQRAGWGWSRLVRLRRKMMIGSRHFAEPSARRDACRALRETLPLAGRVARRAGWGWFR